MPATVRLGTCSWADEGLLKAWYPRGVSGAAARLRYYGERFDEAGLPATGGLDLPPAEMTLF